MVLVTREQFIARAVKDAERTIDAPPGWWGIWRDMRGPNGERVRFAPGVRPHGALNDAWTATNRDGSKSRHGSRAAAVKAAVKIASKT